MRRHLLGKLGKTACGLPLHVQSVLWNNTTAIRDLTGCGNCKRSKAEALQITSSGLVLTTPS